MEILSGLFEPILLTVLIATGGGIFGFFRRISSTQKKLCNDITKLQKTIVILAKAVDRQTKKSHPDSNSDLDDLVKELLE